MSTDADWWVLWDAHVSGDHPAFGRLVDLVTGTGPEMQWCDESEGFIRHMERAWGAPAYSSCVHVNLNLRLWRPQRRCAHGYPRRDDDAQDFRGGPLFPCPWPGCPMGTRTDMLYIADIDPRPLEVSQAALAIASLLAPPHRSLWRREQYSMSAPGRVMPVIGWRWSFLSAPYRHHVGSERTP